MENLEAAARSRSEADWLVGMNSTRAATVRGRALGGVVSLGRVQTPTLALIVRRDLEIDAFVPETYFQVDARFQLDGARSYTGRWFSGKADRTPERERADAAADAARASRPPSRGQEDRAQDPAAAALRPDHAAARREQPLRHLGLAHAAGRAAAVRGLDRRRAPHLPANAVAVPALRPGGRAEGDRPLPGRPAGAPKRRRVRRRPGCAAVGAGSSTTARCDDHHAIIPTGELPRKELSGDDARVFDLVVRRYPGGVPSGGGLRGHRGRHRGRRRTLPHPRPAPAGGGLAGRRFRRAGGRRGAAAGRRRGRPPGAAPDRPGRARHLHRGGGAREADQAAAAATRRRRCSRTWRRPAARSRTRSCGRR